MEKSQKTKALEHSPESPACVVCQRGAYWTVNWLLPQYRNDERLVCGATCAARAVDGQKSSR
jgi:hypothetical protein